ncbi:MAG: hypothetical protein ACYC5M_14665 [Anaerolineae bacterium]
MDWRYSSYLSINQDFIEVFSAEQDERNAEAWMSFIPHQQMLDLLSALLDALERKEPKSLWMHGQFGTGKTMCLFVLKHLLEDPWATIERYFAAQRVPGYIRKRIQGIRDRGQGLIVYLSGSGHIDSNLKFMASLERAVQGGVERLGGQYVVGPLYESVLARLESPGINWPALFDQHKGDFLGLATSAKDVIDQLRSQATKPEPRLALLEQVVRALQSESIVVLDSAVRMKDWLDEVIVANGYQWVVVMWDEFTEFFRQNAALDGLQEMAQFTAKSPFYLALATHRPPENLERGRSDDWKKIRDRFRTVPYLMESVTANKLMARVIQVLPGAQESWDPIREALWTSVKPVMQRLLGADDTHRVNDYAELTPLHPYTAFALSSISQQYSSANRTVFRFMKASGPHGFPQFLADYPESGWGWYTADGLWDFFFSQSDPDTPREFREGISYYQSRQDQISDAAQRRAFKATMLLISLEKELPGVERVRPTLANLSALFAGTPLIKELPQVMEVLTSNDFVRRVGSATGDRAHYAIQSVTIDRIRWDAIRKGLPPFERLLGGGLLGTGAQNAIEGALAARLERRLSLTILAYSELKQRRERAAPRAQPYQISTVLVVCEKDDELQAARQLVRRLSEEHPAVMWVLLDEPFGTARFSQYQDDAAYQLYYAETKDDRNARYHQERCRALLNEWLQIFRSTQLTAWIERQPMQLSGVVGFVSALESAIAVRFPYRPELILTSDPLFKGTGFGVSGAEVGLGVKAKSAPYDQVLGALGYLHSAGKPLQDDKLQLQPDHPVSRMKTVVDELLADDCVNLKDLWVLLQAPPFGLPPAPISVTLFGLLLRECGSGYYWSDGITSHALDFTRLAQLIKETMDGKSGHVLQKSSLEERRLCALLREVFHLDEDNARYLRPAQVALRGEFVKLGYPLWALSCYMGSYGRPAWASISELYDLVSSRDLDAYATPDRLRQLVAHLERDKLQLTSLNDPDSYEAGMRHFLKQHEPRVDSILETLGLSTRDLMTRVKSALEEEVWLWDEEEVATRLPALLDELQLVGALKDLTGLSIKNLEDGFVALDSISGRGKLPLDVLAHQPDAELSAAMTSLADFRRAGRDYAHKAQLAQTIDKQRSGICRVISHPATALRCWMLDAMSIELSEAEAEMLWIELPDLSKAVRDDQVQSAVRQLLSKMERRRAIAELSDAWRMLTGTDSPDSWSDRLGIPIRWLLDSEEETQFLDVVQQPDRVMVDAVREAHKMLESLAPKLRAFTQDGALNKKFTELALGDYAILLTSDDDLRQLREQVVRSLQKPVARWSQQEVRSVALQWVRSEYKTRYLPRVMRQLEDTPAAELRDLLKGFLQDPLVGVRLLNIGFQHEH